MLTGPSSWVSFWLIKTEKGQETPARTGLGATSALAVVTIGFGGKTKPQVAYATALDVFIIICSILGKVKTASELSVTLQ